jgi:hypothetical protein
MSCDDTVLSCIVSCLRRINYYKDEQPFVIGLQLFLQGQCHEMDIFFEGLNILISTFCVYADGFQDLSKAFHYPIQLLLTFYLLL